MTKRDLITEIAIRTGYEKVVIGRILEATMDSIKESILHGDIVYLRGFGSFEARPHKSRVAQNIHGRSSVVVPEHLVPRFKPYKEFKDILNPEEAPKAEKKAKEEKSETEAATKQLAKKTLSRTSKTAKKPGK